MVILFMANNFYKGKGVRNRSDRDRDVKLSWALTVTLKHRYFWVTDSVATRKVTCTKNLPLGEYLFYGLLTI